MKKKKNLIKMSVITGLLLTGSSVLGGSINVMAANPANYKDMTEYSSYESIINYESIKAENSSPYTDVSVALYDIDQDGTKELILSHGTCLADWVNDIYTLKDGKYVSQIGTIGSQGMFYTAPDGNGIYFLYGFQGYQEINRITKSGENITETLIESRELGANENYTEFDNKIELLTPDSIPTGNATSTYNVQVTAPDGGVNMRCGAGVEYDKVLPDMIPNGTMLTVTQEAVAFNGNSWGYTNYNGTYGWIALTQVTKYEEPTEGAPIPHTRYVINCNESITLRTNPDVNAAEICQIPLGTAVATFGDAGNGFISVYYQGSSGYCLASYLSDPVD